MTPKQVFLGTLVILATLLGAFFVYKIINILVLLIIAIIFASAISPAVLRVNRKLPLALSIALVYVTIILIVVGLMSIVINPFITQINDLINSAPQLIQEAEARFSDLQGALTLPKSLHIPVPDIPIDTNKLVSQLQTAAAGLLHVAVLFFASIAGAILVLVLAFYWLLERQRIKSMWVSVLPESKQREAHQIIDEIELRLGGYVRGQVTVAFTVALLSFVGLLALQIKFALVLAIFAGIAELIPIIGPFIGAAPAVIVALSSSPTLAFFVVAMYWIIQQVESQLLVPKIQQRYVKLSPLTVVVVVLSGAATLGLIGAMVAVPMASALHVVLQHTILKPKIQVNEENEDLIPSPPQHRL